MSTKVRQQIDRIAGGRAPGRRRRRQKGHEGTIPRPTANEKERATSCNVPNEISADGTSQLEPVTRPQFVCEIRRDLALIDAFDGQHEVRDFGRRRYGIAALGLIAVLAGKPNVDVLARSVGRPFGDVQNETLDARRLRYDLADFGSLPSQTLQTDGRTVSRQHTVVLAMDRRTFDTRVPPRIPAGPDPGIADGEPIWRFSRNKDAEPIAEPDRHVQGRAVALRSAWRSSPCP